MPSITITDADVAAAGAIRSDRTNPMVAGTYNLTIDEWVINETRRRSIDRTPTSLVNNPLINSKVICPRYHRISPI